MNKPTFIFLIIFNLAWYSTIFSNTRWFEFVLSKIKTLRLFYDDDYTTKHKISAAQHQLITSLDKEYSECVQELKIIGNISDEQWVLFVSERSIQKTMFQQQLKSPNADYFHEPNLSEEFKNVFNKACLAYGFSPEAFDIKYDTANLGNIARVAFQNNRPTLLLNKNANPKDIVESLPHELAHCYMNHPIDAIVITQSFYKYFSQRKFKEQIDKCRFLQEHTADILPAVFGFTTELTERKNPSLTNFIQDVSNPNYVYGQAARDALNIIDHRIYRQENEKSLEDILLYYPRCNEHFIASLELKRQQQGMIYTFCRYLAKIDRFIISWLPF